MVAAKAGAARAAQETNVELGANRRLVVSLHVMAEEDATAGLQSVPLMTSAFSARAQPVVIDATTRQPSVATVVRICVVRRYTTIVPVDRVVSSGRMPVVRSPALRIRSSPIYVVVTVRPHSAMGNIVGQEWRLTS